MTCAICDHAKRSEIESALLNMDPTSSNMSVKAIAEHFGVKEQELKIHAMMHAPMGISDQDFDTNRESIVRGVKKREIEMLEQVANEYLVTLKNVGRKINSITSQSDDITFGKLISKSVADLYINTGAEIRQTVKAIADVDQLINGPKDGSASGVAALVKAIRGSKDD